LAGEWMTCGYRLG